jgi:hypothetical protein
MENRLFVIRTDGFDEVFVKAISHSKAKAIAARSLRESSYAYDFWDAICMIRSCRLSDEPPYSPYVTDRLLHD